MTETIVGIDVETTDLDPAKGDIIEVAAIRFEKDTGEEVERLVRLCKPRQQITEQITSLTGITNEMVEAEVPFAELATEVAQFIGDDLIFAHNASFDIAWLTTHGVVLPADVKVWDTFPLASVAWPTAESYNLGTLSDIIGLTKPDNGETEHRAGDDVVMTNRLLQAIRRQLLVSPEVNKKISSVLERANLPHYQELFGTITEKKSDQQEPLDQQSTKGPLGNTTPELSLKDFFSTQGPLAKVLAEFRERKEQLTMAEQVAEVLEKGGKGLVEAPTGTGKSLAYLVPAVSAAVQGKRVLISTYTKHLQDQLLLEDLPTVFSALESSVAVASLKGRSNYICASRFEKALKQGSYQPADAFLLLKALVWLDQGGSGELDELNTSHQESWVLDAIHADALSCRQGCSLADRCYYHQARAKAQEAQVVILNHALLARISTGAENSLTADAIIIDEGHHLEEAVRGSTKVNLSEFHLAELLAPIATTRAATPEVKQRHLKQEAQSVRQQYRELLKELEDFQTHTSSEERLRLTDQLRTQNRWQKVARQAEKFQAALKFFIGLGSGLDQAKKEGGLVAQALGELTRFGLEVTTFINGSNERIQWLERDFYRYGDDAKLVLVDVALSVGAVMEPLYSQIDSLVVTSATLKTADRWTYIEKRLGFKADYHLTLPSPFNLPEHMLVYLVEDSPRPTTPAFADFVSTVVVKTAELLNGRSLVLFTSLKAIKDVYQRSLSSLNKAKIKLYAQGLTGGKRNMLRRFKAEPESVLLGASSFWEGIDIPGETLSAVIIPKLPFPPPYDPVMDAVAENENLNTFRQLSVPQMILALRQGIGRLIRVESDRGAIILLDSRLTHSSYGEDVIASLPNATIRQGPLKDLDRHLKKWFDHTT